MWEGQGATGCTDRLAQETADFWVSLDHSSSWEMGVSAKLPPAEQVCREQLFPLDKPSEQQQLESVELPPQQEGKNRSEELPAAPTHCGGAAAAGNKDLFSSQPQPWTGSLPKPGSNHSRDSRLREGSSSPRFGKDGLCCASLELAEAQVWLVPSYLLTVKPEKKGGKILQLAVNLFAQGLSCS